MTRLPATIYVLDETARERLDYDDPTGIAGQPDVGFVPVPLPRSAPPWQHDLERRGQLRRDTVLVHDPVRPGNYVPIEDADWQLAVSKGHAFAEICQYLGAHTVSVTLVHERKKSRINTFTVEGGTLVGNSAGGTFSNEATEHFADSLRLNTTYSGGTPEPAKAQQILTSTGLDNDVVLQGLVNAVANTNNPPRQRDVAVNLSTEATRTLTATAKLKAPAYFNISADLKRIAKEATKFTVEYHVDFAKR